MTPYIHILVHHVPEFMAIHQRWELKAFPAVVLKKKTTTMFLIFFVR